MRTGHRVTARVPRWTIALFTLLLIGLGWRPDSSPPARAQPSVPEQPSPAPRATGTPAATSSGDEQLQEQRRKLNREIRLIETQIDRLRQEADIDGQAWRAPAAAVAAVGPTLVGLGLLYLLARALSHWLALTSDRLPPRPEQKEADDDDF